MLNELRKLFKRTCTGWGDRVTKDFFMGYFNLKDDRPVRRMVEILRKEKMLIVSNNTFKGYFLTNEERLRKYPIERKHLDIFIGENIKKICTLSEIIHPSTKMVEKIDDLQIKMRFE